MQFGSVRNLTLARGVYPYLPMAQLSHGQFFWQGDTVAAEREPIRGSGGGAASGVQGQSPWSGGQGGEAPLKLKGF